MQPCLIRNIKMKAKRWSDVTLLGCPVVQGVDFWNFQEFVDSNKAESIYNIYDSHCIRMVLKPAEAGRRLWNSINKEMIMVVLGNQETLQ